MDAKDKILAEILLRQGLVDEKRLEECFRVQKANEERSGRHTPLYRVVTELGYVDRIDLLDTVKLAAATPPAKKEGKKPKAWQIPNPRFSRLPRPERQDALLEEINELKELISESISRPAARDHSDEAIALDVLRKDLEKHLVEKDRLIEELKTRILELRKQKSEIESAGRRRIEELEEKLAAARGEISTYEKNEEEMLNVVIDTLNENNRLKENLTELNHELRFQTERLRIYLESQERMAAPDGGADYLAGTLREISERIGRSADEADPGTEDQPESDARIEDERTLRAERENRSLKLALERLMTERRNADTARTAEAAPVPEAGEDESGSVDSSSDAATGPVDLSDTDAPVAEAAPVANAEDDATAASPDVTSATGQTVVRPAERSEVAPFIREAARFDDDFERNGGAGRRRGVVKIRPLYKKYLWPAAAVVAGAAIVSLTVVFVVGVDPIEEAGRLSEAKNSGAQIPKLSIPDTSVTDESAPERSVPSKPPRFTEQDALSELMLLDMKKDTPQLIRKAREHAASFPRSVAIRQKLAQVLRGSGEQVEAREVFSEILMLNPADSGARKEYAALCRQTGLLEEAADSFLKLSADDAGGTRNLKSMVECLRLMIAEGKTYQTERLARQAIAVCNSSPELYFVYALSVAENPRSDPAAIDGAVKSLERAATLSYDKEAVEELNRRLLGRLEEAGTLELEAKKSVLPFGTYRLPALYDTGADAR